MHFNNTDVLAHEISTAIHKGNVETLKQLLQDNPGLATARIVDNKGCERTLLHVAADWPGHFPNIRETIRAIIEAGAEPSPSFIGGNGHAETPLHGAASSDDVDAIDALLDGGADIEAPGAIFTGGTAMSDAVVFANYNAARRLVERGAQTTIWQAAALGFLIESRNTLQQRLRQMSGKLREPFGTPAEAANNRLWNTC